MLILKKKIIRAFTTDISLSFIESIIPYLKEKYEIELLASPGEYIDRICMAQNIVGYRIYMHRHISPFKDFKSLFQLIKVFYKEKPYMVHSMTPKAGLLCMLAAWLTRVPRRVHTFTGLIWPTETGFKRKILMFTDWLTCTCATHVIPEGKGVMNDLQQHITKKPMKVLGYGNIKGVDMIRFSRRPEVLKQATTLKKEDVFTFIFVGRIVGDKGINELVMAFKRLNQEYPNTRLLLIGRFEEKLDPIKNETKLIIDTNPSIETVGSQYGDDLLAYYAASDCFVFPSYREGFPNAVLEAGAMGLPSIVTDINGSREIIVHGKNGVIIPSKDVDALYTAMKELMIDKEQTLKLANNARWMIESRFEESFVRGCLYDFYDEIMR